ncbi:MAG: 16S rRNA (adenine(1518)-N(6)/adenine(1519)-N(6))-dimethyltransferase RsmA [Actinomycetota bacterium]
MRLLAAHGLRPDTDLGQHFLIDENLADLAVREGRVAADDVVLEVGAGVGVLTVALARAARHVHTVEIDRRLEPALAEALTGVSGVDVVWGDAMRVPLEALDPPPTALVANLPYSVATPLVVESTWRLPGVTRWAVMVQREVADRWTARPGSRLYGAPTVLLSLCTEVVFRRAVGREVFTPRPRVDSAFVVLTRTGPGAAPEVRSLVRAAFASRRKTLANGLAAAGRAKAEVRDALAAAGLPEDVRPEAVAPATYRDLARELRWTP